MSDISIFTCTITEDISFMLGPRSSFASSITFLLFASTVGFTIYPGRDYLSLEVMTSPPSIPAGVCPDTSMLRPLKKFDSAGGSDERCSFGSGFQGMLPNVSSVLTFYVVSNVIIKRMLRDNTNRIYSVILTFTCAATVFFSCSMSNHSFSTMACWAIFCCSSCYLPPYRLLGAIRSSR